MAKDHLKELQNKNEEFIKERKLTLNDLKEKILVTDNDLNELYAHIEIQNNTLKDLGTVKSKIEKLKSLRVQMQTKSNSILNEIDFFTKHKNCPTCKQEIESEFSCEIVNNRQNEINEIEIGLSQLSKVYEETNQQLDTLLSFQKQLDSLKTEVSNNLLKKHMYQEQYNTIQKEIEQSKQTVKSTASVKIVDYEKEYTSLVTSYNNLQEDKLVLSAAASLLKDGGIKTKIINQYIPIINKLINKYLSEFDLFVEFYLDEQFNEVIKSRYRDEFSYSSFSEGEKQKIDLAILFTWRAIAKLRNSMNTNLLVLDEVMDSSLDGNSTDELFKILQTIGGESSIYIISHRDNLHDKFENIIRFVKHKNFSKIEE
jgi:DNA repair exonuclease SbcCD ATPase subunit